MPRLTDFRRTKTIILPSYPDSKVEIYDAILMRDAMEIDLKEENQIKIGIEMLPKYIKSWNFLNEKNEELPISKDSLNFFTMEDLTYLINELSIFIAENKKKQGQ